MKRCPTCRLTLDEAQTFCTNDGTPIVPDKSYDPQATMIMPPGVVQTAQNPAGRTPSPQTGWQEPARQTSPPVYAS